MRSIACAGGAFVTCKNPKKIWLFGKDPITGKQKTKITGLNCVSVVNPLTGETMIDFQLIPCGRCLSCRLNNSRQWAMRCALEASCHDFNYFVTLTYDDDHNSLSLKKDDFVRFINSLRKRKEREGAPPFKYFGCGEYGGQSLRPHYHLCLFGVSIPDLKFYKRSKTGTLYNSDYLSSLWNKGHVVIAEFSYNTAGYVARYTMKKAGKEFYEYADAEREFVYMSRRPGIGFQYFDEHKDEIYENDVLYFSFNGKSRLTPPKYFDYLFKKIDEDRLESVKMDRRLKAGLNSFYEFLQSDLADENDYNFLKAESQEHKYKVDKFRNGV